VCGDIKPVLFQRNEQMMTRRWTAILALGPLAAAASGADTPVLKIQEHKSSYAVGVDLARALKRQGMEEEFRQLLTNFQTVARRKQAL